jgi:predicted aconitase with swiveling domain
MVIIRATPLVAGFAEGLLLVSRESLSFWGGYDPATGEIIDRRHSLSGKNASKRILAIPYTRGSSTTTAVFLESVRGDTAPAAFITTCVDKFLVLGAIVAKELYEKTIPVLAISIDEFEMLIDDQQVEISEDGWIKGSRE